MRRLIIISCLLLSYIPTRPPEPEVPFVFDPNQVNYEIIESVRAYPHSDITFTRKITEPDGQTPTITFSDPTILVSLLSVIADPNDQIPDPNNPGELIQGPSKIYTYDCVFPVNRPPGIYYVDVQAADNDPNEPMFDNRTMIFYIWPKNRPPVIW